MKNQARLIRKAKQNEVEAVFLVISKSAAWLAQQGFDNWKRYSRATVDQLVKSNELYVLVEDNLIIGTIQISKYSPSFFQKEDLARWNDSKAQAIYFTALAILPKHHGNRYGLELIRYAEQVAFDHGINYLRMTMNAQNANLKRYYEKLGFVFRQERWVSKVSLNLAFGEKQISI